jgi:CP family cyanate transporter-like MFS transporter
VIGGGPARLLLILLAAANLRPALTSFGALLHSVGDGVGAGPGLLGALTALPPACFAVAGAAVPALLRRTRVSCLNAVAMALIGAGLAARSLGQGVVPLALGSAAAFVGIGLGNVLMPVAVREQFATRIGPVTGAYSVSLTAGASLAAALSVPAATAFGSWRWGLGIWAVPAGLAAIGWGATGRRDRSRRIAEPAPPAPNGADDRPGPRAWSLAVFFGIQAAEAYVVLSWLPDVLEHAGVSAPVAGVVLALTPAAGIPLAFAVPALAARSPQAITPAIIGLAACGVAGYTGLLVAPSAAPWLWAALFGISQASFPLALAMIALGAGDARRVARTSAFVQGVGYLVSVPCALAFGALVQWTGGFRTPITVMAGLLVVQAWVGAGSASRATRQVVTAEQGAAA